MINTASLHHFYLLNLSHRQQKSFSFEKKKLNIWTQIWNVNNKLHCKSQITRIPSHTNTWTLCLSIGWYPSHDPTKETLQRDPYNALTLYNTLDTTLTPYSALDTTLTPYSALDTTLTPHSALNTTLKHYTELTPYNALDITLTPYNALDTTLTPYSAPGIILTACNALDTKLTPYNVLDTTLRPYNVLNTTLRPYNVLDTTLKTLQCTGHNTDSLLTNCSLRLDYIWNTVRLYPGYNPLK